MNGVNIYWAVPEEVLTNQDFSRVKVFRSAQEQTGYVLLAEFDSLSNGNFVTNYTDLKGMESFHYYVKYFNPQTVTETSIVVTFFVMSPRETRLVEGLKGWVPAVVKTKATTQNLQDALKFALGTFNIYPPETAFTISSFPKNYEHVWVMQAQIVFLLFHYLGVGIRDFSYSDNGLSLTLDRGAKMQQDLDKIMAYYNELIKLVKLNFATTGVGIGTVQIPFGIGGGRSRNVLNVLDIFSTLSGH